MISILCLNPSLDRSIHLQALVPGATNRVLWEETTLRGKGINAAMALRRLGQAVHLVLPRHREGASALDGTLSAAGISFDAIPTPGALRVNLKLMDQSSGTVTEVNAQGTLSPQALEEALHALVQSARRSTWVVLNGSLPDGCSGDTYARAIRQIRAQAPQCKIALDAEGEPFALAVAEKPDLVKPNRFELEMYCDRPLERLEEVRSAAGALVERGVQNVLVSLDRSGALLATREGMLRSEALQVTPVNTVGAGDALLSGYLSAIEEGASSRGALARGMACAAASVAGRGESWPNLLEWVRITP